ncbi:MAG: hypothetical protein ACTSRI_16930 [Promethearchaeota archaeon]
MKKEGYKFQKFQKSPSNIKMGKNSSVIRQSSQQPAQLRALCGCGSGRIFKECCYRSDHRTFNLTRYIEKLKSIKLRMNDLVFKRFLGEYVQVPEIQEVVDEISDQLCIPTFQQAINVVKWDIPFHETPEDITASAIQFETLSIDRTLPGHKLPIIQEYLRFYLRKASERKRECYNSYAFSQFSLYEVVAVKKHINSQKNTWIILRDLFTNEKFEFKDPLISKRLYIWDIVIGRLYKIAGFNIFSTAVFIITPHQKSAFNRILFSFWLKEAMAQDPSILNRIKLQYPQLLELFSDKYASLQGDFFHTPTLRAFLKQNSPLLFEINRFIVSISHDYPMIFKSPDGYWWIYSECKGKLDPGNVEDVLKILRTDTRHFIETSENDNSNTFTFDYFISRNDEHLEEGLIDTYINPKKLVELSKEAIVHRIFKFLQKSLIFGATSIMADFTMDQKAEAIESLTEGSMVRIGFVEIKGLKIKLTTYSKESMQELQNYLLQELSSINLQLSAPRFTDMQRELNEQEPFSSSSTIPYPYPSPYYSNNSNNNNFDGLDVEFNKYETEQYNKEDNKIESNLENDFNDNFLSQESMVLRAHLKRRWFDTKLPLLGGKTPKECVSDQKNLPRLVDLIKEMENDDDRKGEYDLKHSYSTLLNMNLLKG